MRRNHLLWGGVLAAVVYVAAVIIGGALRPGYSHLSEPISELTAAGAPNKALLDVFFLVYNLFVILFGVGLVREASSRGSGRVSGTVSGAALVATGLCGVLLQFFFPQAPGGARAAVTTTGTLHIVFAGLAALSGMIAVLSAALWLRKQPGLGRYGWYSLATVLVMFVSGGFGAASVGSSFAPFGLVERVTIGALIVWLGVLGYRLAADSASIERR